MSIAQYAEKPFAPIPCPRCGKPTVDEQGFCLCGWAACFAPERFDAEPRDLSVGEGDNE